jgi:hypothetical protein
LTILLADKYRWFTYALPQAWLLHVVLAKAAVDRVFHSLRFHASSLACVVFVLAIAALSCAAHDLALAVYALSFWHYYLYLLAYRFGAVPLNVFQRDAILMKTVAVGLCGYVYFLGKFDPASLAVVGLGFSLNALGAWALGPDRTYYGDELVDLPYQRVTRFPYSWISHPMFVGNVLAFGAMAINGDFRRTWWPLACLHVAMNLGLLTMEIAVKPLRWGADGRRQNLARRGHEFQRTHDLVMLLLCAAAGAGSGASFASTSNALVTAGIGASIAAFAYFIGRCYSGAQLAVVAGNRSEDLE